jgi:methionine synthase II (cobalamin-independent)
MYAQYSEFLPGCVINDVHDTNRPRIYIDLQRDFSAEIERFYQYYNSNALEQFAISEHYALGLNTIHAYKDQLKTIKALKGQITGPISFGLQVVDNEGTPIIYNELLADIMVKNLRMKAIWQQNKLRSICSNTIIFIDEPYLTAIGSGTIILDRTYVIQSLTEMLTGLQHLRGIHCCGNTDWALLANTPTDIISFDAYNYSENLMLYANDIEAFIARGGIIAWGIVPNDEQTIATITIDSLINKLEATMHALAKRTKLAFDDILTHALITPACGLGSLPIAVAEKVIHLTTAVATKFRALHELE